MGKRCQKKEEDFCFPALNRTQKVSEGSEAQQNIRIKIKAQGLLLCSVPKEEPRKGDTDQTWHVNRWRDTDAEVLAKENKLSEYWKLWLQEIS